MPHTLIYEEIIATMPEGLEKQVLSVVLKGGYTNPQKRISRKQLILSVYGKAQSNLQNSKEDRQIRRAIVKLVSMGIPILSDSGRSGYYIGGKEDRKTVIIELIRRRDAIEKKIQHLYKANEENASLQYYESKVNNRPDLVQLPLGGGND